MLIIKLQVYIYFNFSQSTTILLVYIMFIIYNIRATSFSFYAIIRPFIMFLSIVKIVKILHTYNYNKYTIRFL